MQPNTWRDQSTLCTFVILPAERRVTVVLSNTSKRYSYVASFYYRNLYFCHIAGWEPCNCWWYNYNFWVYLVSVIRSLFPTYVSKWNILCILWVSREVFFYVTIGFLSLGHRSCPPCCRGSCGSCGEVAGTKIKGSWRNLNYNKACVAMLERLRIARRRVASNVWERDERKLETKTIYYLRSNSIWY